MSFTARDAIKLVNKVRPGYANSGHLEEILAYIKINASEGKTSVHWSSYEYFEGAPGWPGSRETAELTLLGFNITHTHYTDSGGKFLTISW